MSLTEDEKRRFADIVAGLLADERGRRRRRARGLRRLAAAAGVAAVAVFVTSYAVGGAAAQLGCCLAAWALFGVGALVRVLAGSPDR